MKNLFAICILGILFSSCHTGYFEAPLPANTKSFSKIPKKHQGIWNLDSEKDHLTVSETEIQLNRYSNRAISKESDEYKNQIIHKGHKFYYLDEDKSIALLPIELIKETSDSIFIKTEEQLKWTLGHNLIVKKINGNFIYNLSSKIDSEEKPWWTPLYAEIENESLIIMRFDPSTENSLLNDSRIGKYSHDHFFDRVFNEDEVSALISDSCFTDTMFALPFKERVK